MSHITAMDPSVEYEWIPKQDRKLPKEEQLTVIYHPLDMRQEAEISDEQIKSMTKGKTSEQKYLISQADLKRMELSICGWKNFDYPEHHPEHGGQSVPFSKDRIGLLPQKVRADFVSFLTGRDDEDEDNPLNLGEAKTA